MLTYFNESDEIKMDVQVGPQEEVEAKVEGEEFCDRCGNPVDAAKKDPNTVPVGCCINKQTGVKEFYVDAADIAKLAELNEMTMLEALDEIIDVNEGSGMYADNIVVVMSEGTEMYERNLERNGAACVHFNEAMAESGEPDIEMDVQVGPNSEEISVSEDPQEANPVDAVKRQYDSVVVAKDGDKFFMDVEDVQKCAELNCESVIDTINGIIDVNESFDMNTENVIVIVNENTSDELCAEFGECGVMMEASFSFLPKFRRDPELKKFVDVLEDAQTFMNIKSVEDKTMAMRMLKVGSHIMSILANVGSIATIPSCLFIVGIPAYLATRVIAWAWDSGEELFAKEQAIKLLNQYNSLIEKCDDEKVKAELEKKRDALSDSMKKLNKKS